MTLWGKVHHRVHIMILTGVWMFAVLGTSAWGASSGQEFRGLDLQDSTPRWILIRFELSPRQQPDQLQISYTDEFRAWVEPGPEPRQIQIRIEPWVVEGYLLADQTPVPGSFSDYVWIFDQDTGHLVTTTLQGALTKRLKMGFYHADVHIDVEFRMSTVVESGFMPPRKVFGEVVFDYCQYGQPRCQIVKNSRYSAETGYINAGGELLVRTRFTNARMFSPLGEAILREATLEEQKKLQEKRVFRIVEAPEFQGQSR